MKKNFYSTLLLMFVASQIFAQCGTRYKDKIFSTVTKTTVSFSLYPPFDSMDIYQPAGDTLSMRPVIILAHGGSFYGGDRANDPTVVSLCNNFAKRGYVTVSIDYRLGNPLQMYSDTTYAITTVLKALSDGKAAIRYLRKDAATINTFRINPNIIFGGGNSAGAVLYTHAFYVDSVGELPPALQTIINQQGGFEGNSGNPGYSSELQGLINCAGGLNLPALVGPGSKPSVNFQGTSDNTVPYNCGYPLNGAVRVRLCGLGVIEPLYQQHSTTHVTVLFPGEGHCPWDGSVPKFNRVDTTAANFLYDLMCSGIISSVSDVTSDINVSVYPNPATDQINIFFAQKGAYSKVQMLDETGRLLDEKIVNDSNLAFNCIGLSSGLYLVRIIKEDGSGITKKVLLN